MPTYRVTLTQTYEQEATVTLTRESEAQALTAVLTMDSEGELTYQPVEFIATKIIAIKVEAGETQ
jgi:hypothetical protein